MKNSQFFIVTVLLSVVCTSYSIKDGDDVLKPLHDKIKDEFINRNSAYVARQMKKNKPVSHDFQYFLENDESIKKVKQIFSDGTGSFAIEVINKKNEIIGDCKHKRDELNNETEKNIYKKLAFGAMFCISVGVEALGLSAMAAGNSGIQKIGAGLSVGALMGGVGSWVMWSWAVEAQKENQIHIAEITKIEEKLDRNFVEMQKNIKHNHVHPHTTTYN